MVSTKRNLGLVKQAMNDAAIIDIGLPELSDDSILVKTVAVALNPADYQDLAEPLPSGSRPLLMGCDYAGVVEAVGKNVTKNVKKGNGVMGGVHGTNELNPMDGAFAEYITARGDVAMIIPSSMSFTTAATLPSGIGTVSLGFYKYLGLPLPPATVTGSPWILVYGGSSAMGSLALQFAKLSGLRVMTTCSSRNFEFVKSRGAEAVFDYRDPECGSKIRELTSNSLTRVFDTIATETTARICADAMSSDKGGQYVNLMGVDCPRDDVVSSFFLGYTNIGRPFRYQGEEWPAVPEDYELCKVVGALAETLLERGQIKPHPAAVREGGLGGILNGLSDLREGKVSAEKLVYIVSE